MNGYVPAATLAPSPESPPQTGPVKPPVPSSAESERSKHIRFATVVRQLLERHKDVERHQEVEEKWPTAIGIFVSMSIMFIVIDWLFEGFKMTSKVAKYIPFVPESITLFLLPITIGLGLSVLNYFLQEGFRAKTQARAKYRLSIKIDDLLVTFPQECQTWGGRTALADRETVKAILRELDTQEQ